MTAREPRLVKRDHECGEAVIDGVSVRRQKCRTPRLRHPGHTRHPPVDFSRGQLWTEEASVKRERVLQIFLVVLGILPHGPPVLVSLSTPSVVTLVLELYADCSVSRP